MNFAPFAFENSFWSNMTVNLWQGNFTAGASTWTNLVPGGPSVINVWSGTTKNATGVVFNSGSNVDLFKIATGDKGWDVQPNWSLVMYGNVTGTTNQMWFRKNGTTTNGMAGLYSNNPFLFVRAPGSSQQIVTSSTFPTIRGTLATYALTYGGGITGQYFINGAPVTTTNGATTNANLNNGFDFYFGGNGTLTTWGTNSTIQVQLNRLMIFNKKLSNGEIDEAVKYCINNAT